MNTIKFILTIIILLFFSIGLVLVVELMKGNDVNNQVAGFVLFILTAYFSKMSLVKLYSKEASND